MRISQAKELLFDATLESAPTLMEPPKGTAGYGKLSGARTETHRLNNGRFLSFFSF